MNPEKTKMHLISYKDATVVKFNNKRVIVHDLDGKSFGLSFKFLCPKEAINNPAAKNIILKDRVKLTTVSISEDAAKALYFALRSQLVKRCKPITP